MMNTPDEQRNLNIAANESIRPGEGADPSQFLNTSNKFCIDYARRGTAKCRKCRNLIAVNQLRIGKFTKFREKIITQFYHPNCAFLLFKKARLLENSVKEVTEIDGVDNISEKDRAFLIEKIKRVQEKRPPTKDQNQEITYKAKKQTTLDAKKEEVSDMY